MRRMIPLTVRVPRASYTAWSEIAPISARTAVSMSAAVLCGRSDTARRTARRWAVTCTPCRRRRAAWSTDSLTELLHSSSDIGSAQVLGQLEVALRDQAVVEDPLDQANSLLVLRQPLDAELREQR